jgi:hypothetical protein
VYEAREGRRVIAILATPPDPSAWTPRIDTALGHDAFRRAPTWSRYAVLVIDSPKTASLALAAAAFCRDVSKCRRLVAFADDTTEQALPFLGLGGSSGNTVSPSQDLDELVLRLLLSPPLAKAFLDEAISLAQLQMMAEEPDRSS